MVGIRDTPGQPIEPELCRASGNLLRGLIRDYIDAVTEYR